MRILRIIALAWMLTSCAASPKPCVLETAACRVSRLSQGLSEQARRGVLTIFPALAKWFGDAANLIC